MLLNLVIPALLFPAVTERLEENSECFQNIATSDFFTFTTDTV